MGFFDDFADAVANTFDSVSNSISNTKEKFEQCKRPVEGALSKYSMVYEGGLEQFKPKSSDPCAIGLNILPDRFVMKPEHGAMNTWFGDTTYEIPYNKIIEFKTTNRGMGSSANIESILLISFITDEGKNRRIRLEMLDGFTYVGQEQKLREMINFLDDKGIMGLINNKENDNKSQSSNSGNSSDDPIAQLEKLSMLKQKGIITEEEFQSKKAEMLSRL